MNIVPIIDAGLGNSSYVVDLGDGSALVVDPEREPTPYLKTASDLGLRLRFTVETHLHADFVSGSRELVAEGATLVAPAGSNLSFEHRRLGDGDEIDLGGLTMRAIATPGHTPEHLSYLLVDGADPVALFSGGTLMAGGVARTDLLTSELSEPLARAAYRSIRDRLLVLPDDLVVYPTHGAGSFCSAGPTDDRTTTIGRERRTNPLLAVDTEDEFVEALFAGLGSYPTYFGRMRHLNQVGPTVHGGALPQLAGLTPADVVELQDSGGLVVDVRPIDRFAAGHVPNSLSIEMRDQFGTWLGWIADPDHPIALVVDEGQDVSALVWQMLNVGFEIPVGRLTGGVGAWRAAGHAVATTALVGPGGFDPAATILDVRQLSEWADGHLAQATHLELGDIPAQADRFERNVQVHCGHGQRAMTAASLLERAGVEEITVSTGGPDEIAAALVEAARSR